MKRRVETILIGLIVAIFSLVLILVLSRFSGLVEVFIAWATLMLAFAVFITIQHSNEQERRRRKEGRLSEIMEWVDGVLKYCAIYSQDLKNANSYEFLAAVTELKLKIEYITSVAEEFGASLVDPLKKVTDLFAKIFDKLGGEEVRRENLEAHCIEVKKAIASLWNK